MATSCAAGAFRSMPPCAGGGLQDAEDEVGHARRDAADEDHSAADSGDGAAAAGRHRPQLPAERAGGGGPDEDASEADVGGGLVAGDDGELRAGPLVVDTASGHP